MRKIERPQAPAELSRLRRNNKSWRNLTAEEKAPLRQALNEMSLRHDEIFCNYCETRILPPQGHIEHLFARKRWSDLTYEWDNLFLSCDSRDHCGHFKDAPKHDPYAFDDLIHPDKEDPEHFLRFYSTGEVKPREGLTDRERERAEITIRALNLNSNELVSVRYTVAQQALSPWLADLDALADWDREELEKLMEEDLTAFESHAHYTAAKHALTLM